MTKEDKYQIALKTIYNTLKERKFEMIDRAIINSILKYIETVEKYVEVDTNEEL